MKINPGVGYTSANLGEASGLTIDAGMDWTQRNIGRQFECSITGAKVGDSYEYRLHVRKGLVEFDYYVSTEQGIIDTNNLGGINGKNVQNMFFYMNKFNVFPEGSRTEGTEEKSEFFSKNGFIKLETGKNYFVFLYKTTPDWKDSDDLWEAKAPQIGISGDNDEPNNFIRTRRNGGGILRSYYNEFQVTLANLFGWNQTEGEWQSTELPLSGSAINFDGYPNPPTIKAPSGDFGYKTTDCYRQDIAYIEWNAELNRFKIYQIQYGPIRLRQNPVGSLETALIDTETGVPSWGSDFDLCSDITGDFSGYTKDLNHAYYVPPAPAEQIPAYAGQIALGEYQSPKETL
jgi:hypothetical protein